MPLIIAQPKACISPHQSPPISMGVPAILKNVEGAVDSYPLTHVPGQKGGIPPHHDP